MRGEETQVVGALASDRDRMLAVLPGNAQQVGDRRGRTPDGVRDVHDGRALRGAARAQHPRADGRHRCRRADATGDAFARGVANGLAGAGFSHVIFGARSLALTGELQPKDVGDWLSGALIGQEIQAARAWAGERCETVDAGHRHRRRVSRRALPECARARRSSGAPGSRRRRGARALSHRAARAPHRVRVLRASFSGIRMDYHLADFLEPLPLIAVLRGITPEEIPAIGTTLVVARVSHHRSAAQLAATVRVDSPSRREFRRPLPCRRGDRHRCRRRRQSAGGGRARDRDAARRHAR